MAPGRTPPTRSIALMSEPVAARTRPSAPHSKSAAPSKWNRDCFQTTARAKKCAPTTKEIQATAACGVAGGPLQDSQPDRDSENLGGHNEPVPPAEAPARWTRDHGAARATDSDQHRDKCEYPEDPKQYRDPGRQ